MAIVVKWREDSTYLSRLLHVDGEPHAAWSEDRKKAIRFGHRGDFARIVDTHFGGHGPMWPSSQIAFIRIVPMKRHASPQL